MEPPPRHHPTAARTGTARSRPDVPSPAVPYPERSVVTRLRVVGTEGTTECGVTGHGECGLFGRYDVPAGRRSPHDRQPGEPRPGPRTRRTRPRAGAQTGAVSDEESTGAVAAGLISSSAGSFAAPPPASGVPASGTSGTSTPGTSGFSGASGA